MGVLLALLGALAFALMNVFVRKGVRAGNTDNGVLTTVVINAAIFAVLLTTLLLTTGVEGWTTEGFVWFVLAGMSSTFFGRQALFGGIRHLGAARAAAIKNATPVVTLAIALTFLGERLTLLGATGITITLFALFTLVRESLRSEQSYSIDRERDEPVGGVVESTTVTDGRALHRARDLARRSLLVLNAAWRKSAVLGITLAALAALSFGTGHALRKVAMELWPNAIVGATIGSWTALVAYSTMAAFRGNLSEVYRAVATKRPYFWGAGAAGTMGQICFFAALAYAPVSHVSVVASSEAVLTVVLAALLAGRLEALSKKVILPTIGVFLGSALLALAG